MNAGNLLRASEVSALNSSQFVSSVKGKALKAKPKIRSFSFSLMFLVTLAIAAFAVLFTSGNLIPSAISERLIEETDIQYADAAESKMIVFGESLKSGNLPSNTVKKLEENGVKTIPSETMAGSYALQIDDKTIEAKDFYNEVHNNIKLYEAFNNATYGRAAYYYDDSAQEVFSRLGTSRNNYNADSDFDTVMSNLVGEGSDISNSGVTLVKREKEENGQTVSYYEYVEIGTRANSRDSVDNYINNVINNTPANSPEEASLKTATSLNIADTISKEQKSSIFFLAFMENISKMKAGLGSESKINEAMSYLNRISENKVIDVETGEEIIVKGSPLESPSLYAILSHESIDTNKTKNYASDRVLNTIENKTGTSAGNSILHSFTASTSTNARGSIGSMVSGTYVSNSDTINTVSSTINYSMINNSFSDINGVVAGEMLVEGAVNVGKELAKASGATPGSAEAVKSYARVTSNILAMDASIDRAHRSPFDITSKNTFLGSIFYNFAIHLNPSSFTNQMKSITTTVGSSIASLLPVSYADDNTSQYLSNFGNCKTIESIGAVGSATCSEIATFDTSTLGDIFNDPGFIDFLNKNTTISNGTRTVNENSALDFFIKYNNKRITPIGVIDGGIIDSIKNKLSSISFVSNISSMVESLSNSDESIKKLANGAAFVNSNSNNDWNTYKYAQRYVSLVRASNALNMYNTNLGLATLPH